MTDMLTPPTTQTVSSTLDLHLVRRIREEVASELSDRVEASTDTLSDDDQAALADGIIWERLQVLAEESAGNTLSAQTEAAIFRRVKDDLFGIGGFAELVADKTVENIFVNGCDRVFVSRSGPGGPVQVHPVAESDEALIELINRWAARLGRTERRFDIANPRLDLRLPGGLRLHAIMEVANRPTITIRCPPARKIGLREQLEYGTITPELGHFLQCAVRARLNIIVAGGTGTGKTTMLRSLLYEVPRDERIITIEDTAEIALTSFPEEHPNVVELETRQANVEGVGDITMMDLTRECLRMSPDRVVVGEVRGAEALYMLKAMSQGNDGSMCTVHADSARGVADRVKGYCAEGLSSIPMEVIESFFRNAVDLVVHLKVLPDANRTRVISSIVEVHRDTQGGIRYEDLFEESLVGPATPLYRPGPRLLHRLNHVGLSDDMIWRGHSS